VGHPSFIRHKPELSGLIPPFAIFFVNANVYLGSLDRTACFAVNYHKLHFQIDESTPHDRVK
jgi:hypothetical protein